jgi:hypothetical protein
LIYNIELTFIITLCNGFVLATNSKRLRSIPKKNEKAFWDRFKGAERIQPIFLASAPSTEMRKTG